MQPNLPLSWLLSQPDPWVRWRAQVDLLDLSTEDVQVSEDRLAVLNHPVVRNLISRAKLWDEVPLKRHNDANHPLHTMGVLADFGLKMDDPGMEEIIERLATHVSSEGLFQSLLDINPRYGDRGGSQWSWMLCDAPLVINALIAFGYYSDNLLQSAIDQLTGFARENGWPCVTAPELSGFRGPGRKTDPCPYANLVSLRALSLLPETHNHPAVLAGVEMILQHWQDRKEKKYYLFGIGTDFGKLKYPLIWYDVLHVVSVLGRFEFARSDQRLHELVNLLANQQDENGCFTPSSVWMAWKGWDFAQKKVPSPWLTLMAHRALRPFRPVR